MFLQACVIKIHTVNLKALRSSMAKMLIQKQFMSKQSKSQLQKILIVQGLCGVGPVLVFRGNDTS